MTKSKKMDPVGGPIQSYNGKLVITRMRKNSWSAAKRGQFLDHLAATCNVAASAAAVGGLPVVAYKMRRRDPAFAQQWQLALETGYAAIEALLLERAKRSLEIPIGESAVPDPQEMTTELALRLLAHHARGVSGGKRGAGPPPRRASEEETCNAILKKLNILRARIDAGRA